MSEVPVGEQGGTTTASGHLVSTKEEILLERQPQEPEEIQFHEYLGIIEGILLSERFGQDQDQFFREHCDNFEVSRTKGECSHDCIHIFQSYCLWVERFIEREVNRKNVLLNLNQFISHLQSQLTYLQGEVFDILYSMSDFDHFQNTMLQYRQIKRAISADRGCRSIGPHSGSPSSRSTVPYEKLDECLQITGVSINIGASAPNTARSALPTENDPYGGTGSPAVRYSRWHNSSASGNHTPQFSPPIKESSSNHADKGKDKSSNPRSHSHDQFSSMSLADIHALECKVHGNDVNANRTK